MRFDATQNLRQPVGARTTYELAERVPWLSEEGIDSNFAGRANVLRTDKGLLVTAELQLRLRQNCSRCLKAIDTEAILEFTEEYLPTVDVETGEKLSISDDAENFRIDARQTLDLTEAIRQYSVMVKPIQPLCRPDCAGLCPNCGADLNFGPCSCSAAEVDERWASLGSLAAQLKREEGS